MGCEKLKVAIIGAGLSGLSCAYEFKKNGIIPTVFERKRRIGEDVDFTTTTLKLFDRTYKDPLVYLKDKYDIELKPLNELTKIIMQAPKEQTFIENTKGHIFCRGDSEHSLENQLLKIADVPITYYKQIYIDDIKKDFDYIIDATGALEVVKQFGVFTTQLIAYARISVISGSFEPDTIKMWLNTEYAKNCFAFQLPHSDNKACLALTVNDITHSELDYYWEKFITQEKITNTIIKTTDIFHEAGAVYPHKVDNIYFVGKAGGFLGSVLGFGMINGIETGVLAARAIIHDLDYEELVSPISDYVLKKYNYRKVLNTLNNDDFDKAVKTLGLPVIKKFVYNNPIAKIAQGSFIAKAYSALRNNYEENKYPPT